MASVHLDIPKPLRKLIGKQGRLPSLPQTRYRVNSLVTVKGVGIFPPSGLSSVMTDLDADTGSYMTFVYKDIIESLQLPKSRMLSGVEARGKEVPIQTYRCLLQIDGQKIPVEVAATNSRIGLLGYWVLESFGLGVDPVSRRIVQARLLI